MPASSELDTLMLQVRPKLDISRTCAANSLTMPKILVLHGPNLNLLGQRETHHYGHDTLQAIDQRLVEQGRRANVAVETFQSNAAESVNRFLSGEGEELHQVALATKQAELTFDLFMQVRNKVVAAYDEVMRMQV